MLGSIRSFIFLSIALLSCVVPHTAWAIRVVGTSSVCTYHSIQAAIDAILAYERAHPGEDADPYIAVAGGTYHEALSIDSTGISDPNGALIGITGGWDRGCNGPEVGSGTFVDATGKNASVLTVRGNSRVYLATMLLQGGNTGNGGGIDFKGSGFLDITNTDIVSNRANYGGGIYGNGTGAGLTITLHHDLYIAGNIAARAGGGIRIEGNIHLTMLEPQTVIYNNTANPNDGDGEGGGLQVVGHYAVADIGSPGYNGSAVIFYNHARVGGGIGVGSYATVRMFSSYAGQAARVESNDARVRGGGVFLDSTLSATGGSTDGYGELCGYGVGINSNTAPDGAAIFQATDSIAGAGGNAFLDRNHLVNCGTSGYPRPPLPPFQTCPAGTPCNTIDTNIATQADSAIVTVNQGGRFWAEETEMRGNSGTMLLHLVGGDSLPDSEMRNSVLAANIAYRELIRADGKAPVRIEWSTIAGNSIGGAGTPSVITASGDLDVAESIVWQPNVQTVTYAPSDGVLKFSDMFVSDASSIDQSRFALFSGVYNLDPEFADAANGNYQLAPGSPAVDLVNTPVPDADPIGIDALRNPRGIVTDQGRGGHYDIGAYERQVANPLYAELYDLNRIFSQTDGLAWTRQDNWTNFIADPCTRYGITCNSDHTHVIGIDLHSNHLSGQFPSSLSSLAELQSFNVTDNQLSGPIPQYLFYWPHLAQFDVALNSFTGPIPSLAGLPLVDVDVSYNALTGPLPALDGIPTLRTFLADDNQLSGHIPPFNGAQLQKFGASYNNLDGQIPSLAGMPLVRFKVDHNNLTGPLPVAPPVPQVAYFNGDFSVCPNALTILNDPAWDALVSHSQYPWWVDCDTIFKGRFDP